MPVYIPKDRLGSGPVPRERKFRTTQVPMNRLSDVIAKATEEWKAGLKEKTESNAEVQRWRTRTSEERGREAVERMVPTMQAVESGRQGREVSEMEARTAICERIAERHDRDKG